ncbi:MULTISPECIES: PTS sugar transporter subunit IIA [Helcococcus]|uniref:PTS fructose transporter subunit IIBC n=1 Tax=Helcococcus bovis TaxID=3153252 RepID=A0ABW9F5Y1_9FIRM
MSKSTAVLVTAHGKFSEGILSTVEIIAGKFENVKNVNFLEGENFEMIDKKLIDAYNSFSNYDHVIVITDLMGGTPFNRSVMNFGGNDNTRILAGLNFAMLFTAITTENDDIDLLVDEIIEAGKDSIQKFELVEKDDYLDDFEDGI